MKIVDNGPSSKIEQPEVMNKPVDDSLLGTKSIPLLYLRFVWRELWLTYFRSCIGC